MLFGCGITLFPVSLFAAVIRLNVGIFVIDPPITVKADVWGVAIRCTNREVTRQLYLGLVKSIVHVILEVRIRDKLEDEAVEHRLMVVAPVLEDRDHIDAAEGLVLVFTLERVLDDVVVLGI